MYLCDKCKHLFEDGLKCKAFPKEIPILIASGQFDHRKEYPGQENDIVFEPIEE